MEGLQIPPTALHPYTQIEFKGRHAQCQTLAKQDNVMHQAKAPTEPLRLPANVLPNLTAACPSKPAHFKTQHATNQNDESETTEVTHAASCP